MKISTIYKYIFVIISLLQSFGLHAQTTLSDIVHVEIAGTLSSLIPPSRKNLITDLTLTGNLNGTDIKFIREMAGEGANLSSRTKGKLTKLNIADANIVKGGDYYRLHHTTENNVISDFMFEELRNLTLIVSSE